MKTLPGLVASFILTGAFMASCSETQFGASTPAPAATNTSTSTSPDGGDTDSGCLTNCGTDDGQDDGGDPPTGPTPECVDGDFIEFKYNGPIKACIDQGKMWNFDSNECTNMRKASFDCSFDSFFAELERISLQPSQLLKEGKAGKPSKAYIMGCGESADQQTILIQWFFAPEGGGVSCNFDKKPGLIITGCYGKDSGPSNVSPEQKKKIVLDCMNGLK